MMRWSTHIFSAIAAMIWSASAGATDLQDQVVASMLGHAAVRVTVVRVSPTPEGRFEDRIAAAIGGHPESAQSAANHNQPAQQNRGAEPDLQARIAASIIGKAM